MVPQIDQHPIIGRQLFDVITSGMYDNPLMIFREYIQNAVDSIDLGVAQGTIALDQSNISIQLQGQDRTITVMDNGVGLTNKDAHVILRSLGCSPKEGTNQRGFRGIGRLGGLAYCGELLFETRSSASEQVAVISWDRNKFETLSQETGRYVSLFETIEAVSTESFRDAAQDEPDHFFKVTLKNVQRFHSDVLMNLKIVSDYLSQVAPVGYDHDKLLFAPLLEEKFAQTSDFRCYNIVVNGRPVRRPYSDKFPVSTTTVETINDIEFFTFTGVNNEPIALGWYAKTNFQASLPAGLNCRGIRVRQGNIEVGGERFLDDLFTERRFSSWQVGEIHILNCSLKPNARRDGFEQSPAFERFLEQASLLGRHLSGLCRKSSEERTAKIRVENTLNKLEQVFISPITYLDEEHYEQALQDANKLLQLIEKAATNGVPDELKQRFYQLKDSVEGRKHTPVYLEKILDGRRLRKFDQKSLLKHIAKVVMTSYDTSSSAEDILQEIFTPFTVKGEPSFTPSERN
ncbi:MAG: ATP-binding protein [Geobacter sp.]